MNTKIYFLTGASGVGKTTIADSLRKAYPSMDIYGFDSIGVPDYKDMIKKYGSGEEWQKQTTFKWIEKIKNTPSSEKVIIEGQVNIDYIREAFSKYNIKDNKIILINCNENEMIRRLTEERNQGELANQDMKNWRNFLENQAKTYNIEIINTSSLSLEEVISSFQNIVTN